MLNIIIAGGWLMIPLIASSIIALAVIVERCINLQEKKVAPKDLCNKILDNIKKESISSPWIKSLKNNSPLGFIMATALLYAHKSRDIAKEHIEEAGRHIVHKLEKNLNALGTISATAPLLGLLGTVFGMIDVFNSINKNGVGNATNLAGGISEALITTAAGLIIAIPAVMVYRYFQRRIDDLAIKMEQEALNLLDELNKLKDQMQESEINDEESVEAKEEV